MKTRTYSALAIAAAALMVLCTVAPASAAPPVDNRDCMVGDVHVGGVYGASGSNFALSKEFGGECTRFYVRSRYVAYVGGPSYWSAWTSHPVKVNQAFSNTTSAQHRAIPGSPTFTTG